MITPVVRRCPDGHFRHVIFDLINFIADYPEQVMLTGIVQGWCPKQVFTVISIEMLTRVIRCTALHGNLDVQALPRKRNHTDALVECLNTKTLWDEYGIDEIGRAHV